MWGGGVRATGYSFAGNHLRECAAPLIQLIMILISSFLYRAAFWGRQFTSLRITFARFERGHFYQRLSVCLSVKKRTVRIDPSNNNESNLCVNRPESFHKPSKWMSGTKLCACENKTARFTECFVLKAECEGHRSRKAIQAASFCVAEPYCYLPFHASAVRIQWLAATHPEKKKKEREKGFLLK